MTIPVVIAHFGGAPNYLKLCLQSAAEFNRDVVLIGDETNSRAWNQHWDVKAGDLGKFREFMGNYIKMNDTYESVWMRLFAIEAWMNSTGVREIFLLDSDVLSFANYSTEVLPMLSNGHFQAGLMTSDKQKPYAWWHSPHFSYWTQDALKNFTNFSINAYRDPNWRAKLEEKYEWHRKTHHPGGVCEMTLLHLWAKENQGSICNLAQVVNNSTADICLAASEEDAEEYEMLGGFKKLVFHNGIPHGINKLLNHEVRFWCVHCQGASKGTMRFLYNRELRLFFPGLYYVSQCGRMGIQLGKKVFGSLVPRGETEASRP